MLCYTCYIPAAKQRKWASYGPPISYFLRKIQQFWICVISTLHFILCRKSVEITAFFAASTSAYYRQLPICSLRLQRLKIPRPSKACRFEPGYQHHHVVADSISLATAFLRRISLIPSLLLSKPNPLRWASPWCSLLRRRFFIIHLQKGAASCHCPFQSFLPGTPSAG